jgi:hypothetical protein
MEEIRVNNRSGVIKMSERYAVDVEANMIVPFKKALYLLQEMDLPVYSEYYGEYKVHFRDVCKRLAYLGIKNLDPDFDPTGLEMRHVKYL